MSPMGFSRQSELPRLILVKIYLTHQAACLRPGDPVAMQGPHGVERFKHHQVQGPLQNFSLRLAHGRPPLERQQVEA